MKTLRQLLEDLTDPRRDAFLAVYDKYAELFHRTQGSGHNHQAWDGGYADHIAECIRINRLTYPALNECRPLPFTQDQADICLFLHDVEKPFRYDYGEPQHPDSEKWENEFNQLMWQTYQRSECAPLAWEKVKDKILHQWMTEFEFHLSTDEWNALRYTHGEGKDHKKDQRVAGPLAAHVHHCDNTSARIWFDEGRGTS